tara:strand:- start:2055 stop:2615 length:561 start_codon:yes stop_codon:yes gene_type:complete
MRIISGKLKGKTLNYLKNSTIRPLKDIVKENIFNILSHSNLIKIKLKNSKVLDLYSGIGSFGLECFSRGANKVTFIEKDKSAFKILEKNLVIFSVNKNISINNTRIESFLQKEKKLKFSIFFFDPPFSDNSFVDNLDFIKKNKMYENKHIIIIHREKKSLDKLDSYINILISRNYGRSKIIFGEFN